VVWTAKLRRLYRVVTSEEVQPEVTITQWDAGPIRGTFGSEPNALVNLESRSYKQRVLVLVGCGEAAKCFRINWLAPQVGLEPTTLRLTA
jgi:hypothetical protein